MKIRLPRWKTKSHTEPAMPWLFDDEFYRGKYEDLRDLPDTWRHFCEYGFRENRDPHPLFCTAYYRERYLANEEHANPVLHYLQRTVPLANPHPLFDAELYAEQLGHVPERLTLLEHYWHAKGEQLFSPSPFFDSSAYCATYQDIADCQMNPLYHYLRYGIGERRFAFFDTERLDVIRNMSPRQLTQVQPYLGPAMEFVLDLLRMNQESPTVVCVSHEASLTGAPLIILRIAETLRREHGLNVVNLLCKDGDLLGDFQAAGPTFSLQGETYWGNANYFETAMKFFTHALQVASPVGVVMNSAESRAVLNSLSQLNVPIHSLIHENARCYFGFENPPFLEIGEHSEKVIFPSRYVFDAAMEMETGVSESQSAIIPQGLLRPEMLAAPVDMDVTKLRKRYGVPKDGVLVLGCGKGDSRKGLDFFLSTAISVLNRDSTKKIYFGWLGDLGEHCNTSPWFWANSDIAISGYSDRILFFGQHSDVKSFFDASDVFYLPSRIDPFPCVVNEAMACSLPVVLFEGGSGCVDIVTAEGGAVVPFSDIATAMEAILDLCQDESMRVAAGERNRCYVKENMQYSAYVSNLLDGLVEDMQKPRFNLLETPAVQKLVKRPKTQIEVKQRKRVVFLSPCWNISGVNTFTANLGKELNRRGYDASIVLTTLDAMQLRSDQLPEIPFQFIASSELGNTEKKRRLVAYLKTLAPAVVIPNFDYRASAISAELPDNVRTLGILHSDDAEHYTHGYRMGHAWDKIVSVTKTIESKLLGLNPAFADKSTTINYGVNAPEDRVNLVNRSESIDTLRLVYSGRFEQEQKRILDFVELMSELREREVPFQLTMIGTGSEYGRVTELAKDFLKRGELKLPGQLSVAGVVEELVANHVFCLMSDYEGLPISMLEGLASGCIPVVTRIESGVCEILSHEENALISPLRSPAAMAENLERLYHDGSLRKRLATQARPTLIANELTTSQMVDQYELLLEDIFADMATSSVSNESAIWRCSRVERMLDAA